MTRESLLSDDANALNSSVSPVSLLQSLVTGPCLCIAGKVGIEEKSHSQTQGYFVPFKQRFWPANHSALLGEIICYSESNEGLWHICSIFWCWCLRHSIWVFECWESTQTCILSLKVISNLSVYQYWIKSFYCFQKSGWWCNCGKSKGDMVCQYHQLCWQRMSAFQIYYCYFEQISSHFAFFPIAQTTLIVIPHSSCSQRLTMGRWKGWDSQCFSRAELLICQSTKWVMGGFMVRSTRAKTGVLALQDKCLSCTANTH